MNKPIDGEATVPMRHGGGRRAAIALCISLLAACGGGGGGDGSGTSGPGSSNRAPTFATVEFTATEDADLSAQVTGTDPDGDTLTFARTTDPSNGVLMTFSPAGSFTYRPRTDFAGSDSFGVRIADSQGNSLIGTVTIQVTAVDDPVVARNDAMRVDEGAVDNVNVVANDHNPDGKVVTLTIEEPASVGAVSVANGGIRLSGLPTGFRGVSRFSYRIAEPNGASSVATAAIFVGMDPFRVLFVGDESGNTEPEVFMTDLVSAPTRISAATEGALRLRGWRTSRDGEVVAYRRDDGVAGTNHELFLARTATPTQPMRIVAPTGLRYDPPSGQDMFEVSPDGRWLVFSTITESMENAAAVIVNVADPATTYTPLPASITSVHMRFSADSQHLYFCAATSATAWRLYRTSLSMPGSTTPLPVEWTADAETDACSFSVSPDQSRLVYSARRAGSTGPRHVYFIDPANPSIETRLTHDYTTLGDVYWRVSQDYQRIAYTIVTDTFHTYVAEVAASPNPRSVGEPGLVIEAIRPDNGAILYRQTIGLVDQLYEAIIDSSQLHTSVGEGWNADYDSTGQAVIAQQVHYVDPQMSDLYLTVGAATQPFSGVAQQMGTPDMESIMTVLNARGRALAIIGEGPRVAPIPTHTRLALVSAWAPDRVMYLASFGTPRSYFGNRASVVEARVTP